MVGWSVRRGSSGSLIGWDGPFNLGRVGQSVKGLGRHSLEVLRLDQLYGVTGGEVYDEDASILPPEVSLVLQLPSEG